MRDRVQILLLILSKFKRINYLLFSLKSSENLWSSVDFMGNRSLLIHVNSLKIRSEFEDNPEVAWQKGKI